MGGRLKRGGPFGRKKRSPAPPSPDSVLGRLDRFDLRLEENQTMRQPPAPAPALPPPAAPSSSMSHSSFSAELRHVAEATSFGYPQQQQQNQQHEQRRQLQPHKSSMPSADVRVSLMDRLRLLESRILRLSLELDYGNSSRRASSSNTTTLTSSSDSMWTLQSAASSSSAGEQSTVLVPSSRRFSIGVASRRLGLSERLQGRLSQMSKPKDPKQALDAVEKKARGKCKEEKKRMERTRIYKRWFPVIGC